MQGRILSQLGRSVWFRMFCVYPVCGTTVEGRTAKDQQKSDSRIVHRKSVEVERDLSSQVCYVKSYQRGNMVCTQRQEELWKRN